MIKKLLLMILCIMLTGCFNYKEINDYAIVSAVSIDKGEKDKYTVGIQIMNAKKDEESDASSITFYKKDSNTIYEGIQKMVKDLPKQLYLGHNEVIIISEELLKEESALNFLDYFMRDTETQKDSLIIIAKKEKAYNVLKIITPLETIPSRNLKETIKVVDDYKGTLSAVTFDEFISNLSDAGEDPVLPSVKITGKIKNGEETKNISQSDPDAKLTLSTMGFFENGKLKDYLTSEEEEGYRILSNFASGTYINIKCDDNNYASIRINSSSIKEKLSIKDNKPYVYLDSKITSRLTEYNCKADFLKDKKYIDNIEKKASKKTKKLMLKAINKLYIQNKSDALKYGKKFYSKKLVNNKHSVKYNISFNIKSNVSIDKIGLTIKSIREVKENE